MGLVFANNTSATVTSGGTSAPSSGSGESWTVTSVTGFPTSLASGSYFHVADPVLPTEKVKVTAITGAGPYTWTVTRGDESTATSAHTANFTVQQVVTSGDFYGIEANPADYVIAVDASANVTCTAAGGAVAYSGADGGAALQAAINALASTGGTVVFRSGTYPWASIATFPRNIPTWLKVIGEPGTTITLSNTAKSFTSFNKIANSDVFKYIHVEGFTVDCGSLTQNSIQHTIIGTWTTAGTINNISLDHITVRRCRVINGYSGSTSGFTIGNLAIWLSINQDTGSLALTCTNILVEEIEVLGCQYAVNVAGQKIGTGFSGNCTITGDNIRIRDIKHDVGNDPPLAADTYAHVQVGSELVAQTVWIERVWGRGSRDVGIEVDNLTDCHIRDCHFRNCHGFTVLVTSFNPVPDINNQSYDIEDCTLVRDAGSWDNLAAGLVCVRTNNDRNGTNAPVGTVRARNLRMYVTASSLNDIVTDGVSGDLVNCVASVKELFVDNAHYYATGYQQTSNTTQSFPSVIYITGTTGAITYSKVTLKDIDIFFNAVNVGTSPTAPDLIQISGNVGMLLDNISVNMSVTSPTTNAQTIFNCGTASGTTTLSGTIRRLKVVGQNDTSGTGVNIKGSGTVTIPNEIMVTDCDFSGMSGSLSAGRELQVGDATNAAKVRSRNNKWVTQPKVPYTISTPTSTTATQFVEMWDALLSVTGGTVTAVKVGKASGTLFQVASGTNVAVPVSSGDWFSITWSGSPTVTVIPVT